MKAPLEVRAARQGKSPESVAKLDKYRRDLYWDRKLKQECVDCGRKLTEEDDTVRCAFCREQEADIKAIYRLTRHGAKVRRKAQGNFINRRRKEGRCVTCGVPRGQWSEPTELQKKRQAARRGRKPPQKCPDCTREYSERARKRNELKKQGVISIVPMIERRERNKKKLAELRERVRGYKPIDVVLAKPRVRLLRALRFFDWTSNEQLFDALGVPLFDEDDRTERDAYAAALSRLVRVEMLVERREQLTKRRERNGLRAYEYRLTDTGRAAVKEYGT